MNIPKNMKLRDSVASKRTYSSCVITNNYLVYKIINSCTYFQVGAVVRGILMENNLFFLKTNNENYWIFKLHT